MAGPVVLASQILVTTYRSTETIVLLNAKPECLPTETGSSPTCVGIEDTVKKCDERQGGRASNREPRQTRHQQQHPKKHQSHTGARKPPTSKRSRRPTRLCRSVFGCRSANELGAEN